MDDLSLKRVVPKHSQSWGIANLVTKPQELEVQRKPPNRRAFHGFGGARSPKKRHKVLMCDSHTESRKETPPKLRHENPKKRLRKSPKRENGRDNKSLEKPRRIIYTYHIGSYKV
jgi:hypothetical protein